MIIGVEKTLKEMLCFKGASGLKPCIIEMNMIDHKHALSDVDHAYLRPMTCLDMDELKFNTDETVILSFQHLQESHNAWKRGAITKAEFEEQEKFSGVNHNEWSISIGCTFTSSVGFSIMSYGT